MGMVIFGHLGLRNPWTDSLEIWHVWLRQQSDNRRKIWWPLKMGLGWPHGWSCTLACFYLFIFFWFLKCVHSLPWEAWILAQCIYKRVSVVGVFRWGRFAQGQIFPFCPLKPFLNGPNKAIILHGSELETPIMVNDSSVKVAYWIGRI